MFHMNQTLFTEIALEIVHDEFNSDIPSATLRERRSRLENRLLCQNQDKTPILSTQKYSETSRSSRDLL